MREAFNIPEAIIQALFQKSLTLKQIRIILFLLYLNPEKALGQGVKVPKLSYFTSAGIYQSDISKELKGLYELGIINYDKQAGIYKIESVSDWFVEDNSSVTSILKAKQSYTDENIDYLLYANSKDFDYSSVKFQPSRWD